MVRQDSLQDQGRVFAGLWGVSCLYGYLGVTHLVQHQYIETCVWAFTLGVALSSAKELRRPLNWSFIVGLAAHSFLLSSMNATLLPFLLATDAWIAWHLFSNRQRTRMGPGTEMK